MKLDYTPIVLGLALCAVPSVATVQAGQTQTSQGGQAIETVKFPATKRCTTNEPCRTVMGEIVRVEESYWLKQADGSEVHLTVTPTTNIQGLPKVGDEIAAQLTSRGDAEAVVKLKSLPTPGLDAPEKKLQDLR